MKTLLTVCFCSFSLALASLAQPPPPAMSPAAPPAVPPQPATTPALSLSPAITAPSIAPLGEPIGAPSVAPGMSPAVAPGMSPAATTALSPAPAASPAATAAPAATRAPSGGVFSSNFLIDNFQKGGPIMWPILIVSIIALTVVLERTFWWVGPLDETRSETDRESLYRD